MMISLVPSSETGISKTSENLFGSHFSPIARGPLVNFLLQKMLWAYKVLIGLLL